MYSIKKIKWSLLPVIRFLFLSIGKPWNDFYGWMLNYQDRKVSIHDILEKKPVKNKYKGLWDWQKGEYFYSFIKKHGYKDSQTIFDIGCGYGRLAIPVSKNQKLRGKYIGNEISEKRLKLAKDWIEMEKLSHKCHELIFDRNLSLDFLKDDSVDCFTAFSVFNHMPDHEFRQLACSFGRKIKSGGVGFCHIVVPQGYSYKGVEAFPRTVQNYITVFSEFGFKLNELPDYKVSSDPNEKWITMLKVVRC